MNLRRAFSLTAASIALLVAGCGGRGSMPAAPTLVFSGAPALTVASASGQLSIDVWWSPPQPTVGYDAAQLSITDATGAPVTGLQLTIVPWMAAHGHGASVEPTVSEISAGCYVATPIDFFMSGGWELMTAISRSPDGDGGGDGDGGTADGGAAVGANSAGTINDSADPTVEVP
jgi:hypothetical protein